MMRAILVGVSVFALSGCAHVWWQDAAPDVIVQTPEVVVVDNPLPEPDPVVKPETAPLLPALVEAGSDVFAASARFPAQLQIIAPKLDARLRDEAQIDFEVIEADATTYQKADPEYFFPYSVAVTWTLHHAVGDIVSLKGLASYYTGGAHSNHNLSGLIYDRAADSEVDLLDLFVDREAALARLVPLIRAEIITQKQERYAGADIPVDEIAAEVADSLSDSGDWLTQVALVASDDKVHFGGLEVYFSPYELGSYAEGSYRATVPQAKFQGLLKPEFQALFAGSPVASKED